MTKGERIYLAIFKAVSKWDVMKWLEYEDIEYKDFCSFMEAGKKSLEEEEGA